MRRPGDAGQRRADAKLAMRPQPPARMPGTTARETRKVAVSMSSIIEVQLSSPISGSGSARYGRTWR